jgi:hypothetical protein
LSVHQQSILIDANNHREIEVQKIKPFTDSESGIVDDMGQGDGGGVEGESDNNKMLHNTAAGGVGEIENQENDVSASRKIQRKKKEKANRNLQNDNTTGERHFSKYLQQEDEPKEKKRRRRKGTLCEHLVFIWTKYTDLELILCVHYMSQIGVCIF